MSVASKNLYELLGNTSDQDSDREPEPPTKAIEKPIARSGKRDAPKAAPTEAVSNNATSRGRGGDRRGGFSGSEAAFRDRATGRNRNREQPAGEAEDGVRPGRDRGPGTRSIGRGPRGPRRGGDRHSRTGVGEHQKQADHGWGNQTGEGEWADEKAGDAMATQEVKEDGWDAGKPETFNANAEPTSAPGEGGQAAPEAEAEPEDTSKSYTEYLAEQAAKKLEGLGLKEARQPNEGAKENKKWKSAKELTKADEDEAYFKGEEKARRDRERTRNAKEFLDIDYSFKEQSRDTRGGARGGGRGRGRGDRPERGDRADRGERSDRGDRSEFRGSRGRGDFGGRGRGENRGGRGRGRGDTPAVAIDDNSAFPSLGGK